LIVLFQPDLLGSAIVILRRGIERVETRDGVAMDDYGVLIVSDPYLMIGKDNVVRAVGMLDADGGFDGAVFIEGFPLIIIGRRFLTVGEVNDDEDGGYEKEYYNISTAHGTTGYKG
jgi:hypothetical protein